MRIARYVLFARVFFALLSITRALGGFEYEVTFGLACLLSFIVVDSDKK